MPRACIISGYRTKLSSRRRFRQTTRRSCRHSGYETTSAAVVLAQGRWPSSATALARRRADGTIGGGPSRGRMDRADVLVRCKTTCRSPPRLNRAVVVRSGMLATTTSSDSCFVGHRTAKLAGLFQRWTRGCDQIHTCSSAAASRRRPPTWRRSGGNRRHLCPELSPLRDGREVVRLQGS